MDENGGQSPTSSKAEAPPTPQQPQTEAATSSSSSSRLPPSETDQQQHEIFGCTGKEFIELYTHSLKVQVVRLIDKMETRYVQALRRKKPEGEGITKEEEEAISQRFDNIATQMHEEIDKEFKSISTFAHNEIFKLPDKALSNSINTPSQQDLDQLDKESKEMDSQMEEIQKKINLDITFRVSVQQELDQLTKDETSLADVTSLGNVMQKGSEVIAEITAKGKEYITSVEEYKKQIENDSNNALSNKDRNKKRKNSNLQQDTPHEDPKSKKLKPQVVDNH